MAKRILVPLDTREAHDGIIPVVAALARDSGATVRLLRVFPVPEHVVGPHGRTVAYVDQEMARLTAEGRRALERAEAEMAGVPVESVVRFGEPAQEIVLEAEAFEADLIALGADRQGYLRAALAPGVADRVAFKATVPTLTLRG
ncbi:MAG TPA: universal stress protein [Methylomirabilota bacterium]|jgi:nucleotide-binding universal stress UspA family protein